MSVVWVKSLMKICVAMMKMGKVQTNNFLEKYFQIVQKIIDKLAPKEIIYKPGTSTSHHLKSNSKSDNYTTCII